VSTSTPRRSVDPLLAVLVGVAGGIALVAMDLLRLGLFVVSGALAVGAVLRLLLRPRSASSLVVRGRHLDVFVLATLAVAVAVLAAVTPLHALD
jgi:hypothetical protein